MPTSYLGSALPVCEDIERNHRPGQEVVAFVVNEDLMSRLGLDEDARRGTSPAAVAHAIRSLILDDGIIQAYLLKKVSCPSLEPYTSPVPHEENPTHVA